MKDALAHASWLHVMWRHPEKIGLATEAQMTNVLAPVHVTPDGVVHHSVFWTMALAAQHAGPIALDVLVETDVEIDAPGAPLGSLSVLDAGATFDPGTRRVHVSLVNRHRDEEVEVTLDGIGGDALRVALWHEDPFAGNSPDQPNQVVPVEDRITLDGRLVLPPHSHTTLVAGG